MLSFSLSLKNPWAKEYKNSGTLFHWHRKFFKEKCLEIEFGRWGSYHIFNLYVDLSWSGTDHAGPRLSIDILRYSFEISFYDGRHWNYKTGSWEIYSE